MNEERSHRRETGNAARGAAFIHIFRADSPTTQGGEELNMSETKRDNNRNTELTSEQSQQVVGGKKTGQETKYCGRCKQYTFVKYTTNLIKVCSECGMKY